MNDFAKTVVGGVAAGYALKWLELKFLEPKVSLVWWPVLTSRFRLPVTAEGVLTTHAFTVWNNGRKRAEGIEVVHAAEPEFFALWPARQYIEKDTPEGQHVIEIATLGPREWFTVSIAAIGPNPRLPRLLYVRSNEGNSQQVPMAPSPVWPRWLSRLFWVAFFVGAAFLLYLIIWAVQLGLRAVGW